MAKSKSLPSVVPVADMSGSKDLWISIIRTHFSAAELVVRNRYRWITRMGEDKTPRDYVLEDQGEFLLVSMRHAPNLYVRAGVQDLLNQNIAVSIYSLIKDGLWDHPILKQVLVRVADRAVPLQAIVMNVSHRHSFTADDVMNVVSRVQAEAKWFLQKRKRRQTITALTLSDFVIPTSATDGLDILCRGEVMWVPTNGEGMKAYILDRVDGGICSLRYCFDTGDLISKKESDPPWQVNLVSVARYRAHLSELGTDSATYREAALNEITDYYSSYLEMMACSL